MRKWRRNKSGKHVHPFIKKKTLVLNKTKKKNRVCCVFLCPSIVSTNRKWEISPFSTNSSRLTVCASAAAAEGVSSPSRPWASPPRVDRLENPPGGHGGSCSSSGSSSRSLGSGWKVTPLFLTSTHPPPLSETSLNPEQTALGRVGIGSRGFF